MNIKSKEKINKGWSSDAKYCVTDNNDNKYLLRISSIKEYDNKLNEYKYMQKCAKLGVSMCKPVEFGVCEEGVYAIHTWIDGVDAEDYIQKLTTTEQYQYGIVAGLQLAKIHSINAPLNTPDWETRFNNKIDRKIKTYENCPLKLEKGSLFIEFINNNRHLLKNRPNVYQHGDYHIGNMMISTKKDLVVIDFNRNDFGDPWEEFNRIVWCAQSSPAFATGMVDGYFDGNAPEQFWRLLALYISSNTLSSLPWAIPFGEKEINVMINQAKDVLSWYNDMKNIVPSWYKKY